MGEIIIALAKLFGWTVRLTPRPIRAVFRYATSSALNLICSRERNVAALQLSVFAPSAKCSSRQIFAHACSLAAKSLAQFSGQSLPTPSLDTESLQTLERLKKCARPVLSMAAHVGDWELLARWIALRYPLSVIGRQARIPAAQKVLEALRRGMPVVWRGTKQGGLVLKQSLEQNRWLGVLLDQDLPGADISVPFLGVPAQYSTRLIERFKQIDGRFVSGFLVRNKSGEYQLIAREINHNGSASEILLEFNKQLEEIILTYPEQWMWFHKRWRTQGSERLSHSAYLKFLRSLRPLGDFARV